jgi:hypothetical protein
MGKRYRAVVGLQFADGTTNNGEPKEHRVEPGQLVPERFTIPQAWIDSGKVEEK